MSGRWKLWAAGALSLALVAGAWALSRRDEAPLKDRGSEAPTSSASAPPTPARYSVSVRASPNPSALAAAFDAFLEEVPLAPRAPRPAEVLRDAGAEPDPLAYRRALEASLSAGGPSAFREAVGLLEGGLGGSDERLRFQHSQALAGRISAPGALEAVLAAIPSAGPEARGDLVFALRGSRDPRASEALAEAYSTDSDPRVRAQAGFVIGERGAEWPPLLLERARRTARLDLSSESTPLIKSAADVLGVPPLSDSDRGLLLGTLQRDPDLRRRLAATRALAAAGAPPAEVVGAFQQLAGDPSTPPELRARLEEALEGLR